MQQNYYKRIDPPDCHVLVKDWSPAARDMRILKKLTIYQLVQAVLSTSHEETLRVLEELAEENRWREWFLLADDALQNAENQTRVVRTAEELMLTVVSKEVKSFPGHLYYHVGTCYHRLGRFNKAIDQLKNALSIFEVLGHRTGQGLSLNELGKCYRSLGQYAEAITSYEQALTFSEGHCAYGLVLNNLAYCYSSLGGVGSITTGSLDHYNKAIERYRQALEFFSKIDYRAGKANSLKGIGDCYTSIVIRYSSRVLQTSTDCTNLAKTKSNDRMFVTSRMFQRPRK